MSVLKGEGKYPILYGPYRLPVGRGLPAYIARPDLSGSHPAVILAHGAWGIDGHVKGVCWRLARSGFAVVCPDLYLGEGIRHDDLDSAEAAMAALSDRRGTRDLLQAFEAIDTPGLEWADSQRTVLVGLGAGGRFAVLAAGEVGDAGALVLVSARLRAGDDRLELTDALAGLAAPVLGIYAADDDRIDLDEVRALRGRTPGVELAIYGGVGHGFLDEGRDDYDRQSAEDALERMVAFLEAHTAVAV